MTEPSQDSITPDLRAAAREYDDAGLGVVPVAADGTKRPDLRSWTEYKDRRSTAAEHDQWFDPERRGGARQGIGVVYGRVSGNMEMIEFEFRAVAEGILEEVTEIMEGSGLGEFWKTILTGWATESPSGGLHLRVRVDGAPVKGSTKLASRLAREPIPGLSEHPVPHPRQHARHPTRTRLAAVHVAQVQMQLARLPGCGVQRVEQQPRPLVTGDRHDAD